METREELENVIVEALMKLSPDEREGFLKAFCKLISAE